MTAAREQNPSALREVAALFLRLGVIAFGGPAAHIAMMRDEVVRRRGWLSDGDFLDMVGAVNLIPGPNSTELAIHLGHRRAGWPGLLVGGSLFIIPAALIVGAMAWAYVRYGSTPAVEWLLYGVKPVIIAIVGVALAGLLRTAVKGPLTLVICVAALGLLLVGVNELALLFGGGAVALVVKAARTRIGVGTTAAGLTLPLLPVPAVTMTAVPGFSMLTLFLTFLKIGAVLYGSGYVLLAFLRGDFVDRLGWLTEQQLLDAVAVGQVTPGPVFTTATFVGYVVGGPVAAGVATVAIFLPSFAFVALLGKIVPLVRKNVLARAGLDGVNAAALGLMAGVTWQLGQAALVDVVTVALAAVALVVLLRWKVNSAWLILAGGVVGVAWQLAR